MQWIKDRNSATLANSVKALARLYTFDLMKTMIYVIRDYIEQCH